MYVYDSVCSCKILHAKLSSVSLAATVKWKSEETFHARHDVLHCEKKMPWVIHLRCIFWQATFEFLHELAIPCAL
jgi:hypothetical protein